MEPGDEQPKKPRKERVIIKSPVRLAIFSILILMLGAFAVKLIAEGKTSHGSVRASTSSTLFD